MTEVWWCAVHSSPGSEKECGYYKVYWNEHMSQCQMVRMRLVPVDALVLTRGEDGNWPAWVYDLPWRIEDRDDVSGLLDVLAEAARGSDG